jgi:T4 RnlA family RNA ligase
MPMVALINFIKSHKDWQTRLAQKPYSIRIKKDENAPLYMFTYSMIDTKWDDPLALACRGSILRIENDEIEPVCWPFNKFFNLGEAACANIEWESSKVFQKIDGSFIKYFWDPCKQDWRFVTNGSLNLESELPDDATNRDDVGNVIFKSWKDLINAALTDDQKLQLQSEEWKGWTLFFELTSPYNRVVLKYPEPKLWLLGARNNSLGVEYLPDTMKEVLHSFDIPKIYSFTNPEEIKAWLEDLEGEEGVVVCDRYFSRAKMKAATYLTIHRLKGSDGIMSMKRIYECINAGSADDVEANFPEYRDMLSLVRQRVSFCTEKISGHIKHLHNSYYKIESVDEKQRKKAFALEVMNNENYKLFSNLCFSAYKIFASNSAICYPDFVSNWLSSLDYESFERLFKNWETS